MKEDYTPKNYPSKRYFYFGKWYWEMDNDWRACGHGSRAKHHGYMSGLVRTREKVYYKKQIQQELDELNNY